MSTPIVPPRPQRTQAAPTPLVPPRPVRKTDPSPDREAYTRSPLNGPPVAIANGSRRASQDHKRMSAELLPPRPPSVSLPTLGQEGSEYSSYDQLPPEAHGVSLDPNDVGEQQTKSVSADLPMHQPVASIPKSTAKRQIETVTRTDSTQALAAGLGRPQAAEDSGLGRHSNRSSDLLPLRSKTSFNRSTSSIQQPLERSTSRPGSIHGGPDYEQGIPEIGKQVPLLAYAGDVQAPSPAAAQSPHTPGIGFWNDGSARNHTRKRSSRQEFFHPDSYGLRHDLDNQDQFERAWAAKHPEEAAKEEHYMHLPRPETALSSEQLNKLVHQTGDVGFGTSANVVSTPGEDVAFEASAEYTARKSPRPIPAPLSERKKRPSSGSQPPPESPLRKMSFPINDPRRQAEQAFESEDEQVFHLRPPSRKMSKITGGGDVDDKLDLGPNGEDGGYISEHADTTPILASDEIIKRPGSAFMQAAIEPTIDRHADEYYDSDHGQWPGSSRRNSVNPPSRPTSRPSSVHGGVGSYHGGSLHRFISHDEPHHSGMGTPLEEIEEYEPLFPEDEKAGGEEPKRKFKKRPELAGHHFPSQDIWEDTPASLQYSATVSTPDIEREQPILDVAAKPAAFETPEQEQKRRDQNPDNMTSSTKTFVKPHFKPGVLDDVHHGRPGMQRFPSSDVWEDSPDSFNLTTTVNGPQQDDSRNIVDDAAPARPNVPARPERSSKVADPATENKLPQSKPKPMIPARPVRPGESSVRSEQEPPQVPTKVKPVVPARPTGSKIASIQAGFMNDLNNRLKIGPQGPKKEPEVDEEAEKAPLADARKSRAKGPARRKPQAAVQALDSSSGLGKPSFALSPLITVWTIDEEDELQVQGAEKKGQEVKSQIPSKTEAPVAENPTAEDVQTTAATIQAPSSPEVSSKSPPAEHLPQAEVQAEKTLASPPSHPEHALQTEPARAEGDVADVEPTSKHEVDPNRSAPAAAPEGPVEQVTTAVAPAEENAREMAP